MAVSGDFGHIVLNAGREFRYVVMEFRRRGRICCN